MVSVIMPVYNIEKMNAFKSAVRSVLEQTYYEIEFILVNDGSTDGTAAVMSNLKRKDSRINIITKNNGGVESARRAGIHAANGKYLFHMDQDDLLANDAIEKLVEASELYQADVVVGSSVHFYGWKRFGKNPHNRDCIVLNRNEFIHNYYIGFFGQHKFPVQIWNKLYRKSFIDAVSEPPRTGLYNEDFNYNIHILPEASKIVWLPDITYYYRWGGFTCKKIDGLIDVALSCYRIEMKQIKEYGLWDYEPSTCIELLNFMNSVLCQEVQFETEEDGIRQLCRTIFDCPEVKHAIEIVHDKSNYRNSSIEVILNHDVDGWILHNREIVKKQKVKTAIKRILTH